MATRVTLREKKIAGSKLSLYLDFYPPILNHETGKPTRREFLGMYVMEKPKTVLEKEIDKETRNRAELIRAQRYNNVNKPEVYTDIEKSELHKKQLGERDFIEYFKLLANRSESVSNWDATLKHFRLFAGEQLKFAELTEIRCNEFREYLRNSGLAVNTIACYFDKFRHVLKRAYKDGYLQNDLSAKTDIIKKMETVKSYLTLDELNALSKTECVLPVLKQAALFSALTGLRHSDIEKMTWAEVRKDGGRHFLQYQQQKTKAVEVLPISEQAFALMGERKADNEKVFVGLNYSERQNGLLWKWVGAAGITRHITFHSFRHTYATLQLSAGTDIYTVSKMLGHRDLRMTQRYTKVVDKLKQEATERIKIDL